MKPDLCPKCQGEIWAVEYIIIDPFHYDGTSEWACKNALSHDGEKPSCTWRIGRFCGKTLDPKESEPPRCTGGPHPIHA